ncbi:MAG: MoxR family ATPase [Pseudomonadales bacterium]|nr:MoxR family ATPase [Pseudomonadales bacterium]
MNQFFYSARKSDEIKPLDSRPDPVVKSLSNPAKYHASDELVAAVNVALILGQPLLLTGEPGTGKSQLAYHMAWRLNIEPVLTCQVRSTTTFNELFYQFDELARFRDSQSGRDAKPLTHYLRLNGLGKAILFAGGPDAKLIPIPGSKLTDSDQIKQPEFFKDLLDAKSFPSEQGVPSVVLVDELDKAPRDTPNDMLGEIESMGFDIPELGVRIQLPDASKERPIVVITSNSEKSLPDAFLRRCAYYHIPFPDRETLRPIVYGHLPMLEDAPQIWLQEALELFDMLRDRTKGIRKPPGTAELLGWLKYVVSHHGVPKKSLREQLMAQDKKMADMEILQLLSVLIKTKDEWDIARHIINTWAEAKA